MTKSAPKRTTLDVLRFSPSKSNRATVRRHYDQYRRDHGIPRRCHSPSCQFDIQDLQWNGQTLGLVLDHINGVSSDNSPSNLRLLCPNCDSQLPTKGGKNKGRVDLAEVGYALKRKDGKRDYTLVADPGAYEVTGHDASLSQSGTSSKDGVA